MNILKITRSLLLLFIALLLISCSDESPQVNQNSVPPALQSTEMELEQELIARARGIHEQVITLDTHADINTRNFTQENNYTMDLETQVTLPKMEAGGLDVAWFIVYTGQAELDDAGYAAAYANAIDKFDAIHRLAEEIAPDQIEIAYTSDDVRRINSSGKKVAMIGIENAYPIGLDMSNIEDFHDRGGRYMSLAHNGHSQFADSNTGERDDVWLHNGLSPMGRDAILEMNKWGIMVDISHPSKDAIMEMLDLTQAPLIASHSSARAMSEHSRNLDDETLLRIKENGGVVQTVAFKSYLNAEKNTRNAEAISRLNASIAADLGYEILSFAERNSLNSADRAAYDVQLSEIGRLAAPRIADEVNAVAPPVDVSDFVDHIDYLVEFIGLEHVGISSDFDGGGGVEGWNNAAETFNVTFELVKRGYSEEEIGLLWSGNLLRVLDEVQRIAAELQAQ
ncbi:MAG: peptidase M19 [Gammaproteobacteria bacterium]|jgi:microsomal dipeptidase-like Zn-dependent dipeptidase|nr:peptidase M19 [Gammaproteobacteria bacterium]